MMADYGRFYLLSPEEKEKESNGLLGKRQFSYPFMATGIAAYGAARLHSPELAEKTWCVLLGALAAETEHEGFAVHLVPDAGNRKDLEEIAWISTNFVSQWCLNAIIALDFIRDALPSDWQQAGELLKKAPEEWLRKACARRTAELSPPRRAPFRVLPRRNTFRDAALSGRACSQHKYSGAAYAAPRIVSDFIFSDIFLAGPAFEIFPPVFACLLCWPGSVFREPFPYFPCMAARLRMV